MANIKIAQLTNKTSLVDTDLIVVESSTQTMKMTVGKLKELLGIQSGGIVESGSNANGSYVKFADGTMICRKTVTQTVAIDVAWGSLFYGPQGSFVDFGAPAVNFIDTPDIGVTLSSGSDAFLGTLQNQNYASLGRTRVFRGTSNASVPCTFYITAIGRWK